MNQLCDSVVYIFRHLKHLQYLNIKRSTTQNISKIITNRDLRVLLLSNCVQYIDSYQNISRVVIQVPSIRYLYRDLRHKSR